MNASEMRAQMDTLITELEGLRDKDERSADDDARIDSILNEVNDIGLQLVRVKEVDGAISGYRKSKESRGTVAGVVAKGESEPEPETRDQPSGPLGQRVYDAAEMDWLRQRGGEGVASYQLDSFWREQRAIANTDILPSDYLEPMRIPGIQRDLDPYGTLRDVLNVGQTNSDSLVYFRESNFDNQAGIVGEATSTTGSSGEKPESGLTFDQQTGDVVTIAHWIPITRQMIWNAPEMRTYIEGRLIDGLKLFEDEQLLVGEGGSGMMTGLLNTSNVQVLDNDYFDDNPVDAGTVGGNALFNRVLRARTLISSVGRARANFVVLNPHDHERFLSASMQHGAYFGQGPFAGTGVSTLWGLRVVENEHQPQGRALVGDGRQATIWDRMQAQVLVGTIERQFIRNMLTLLAEQRIGLTVFRPQAFADVSLDVSENGGGNGGGGDG